jgi:hypothetical protein
MPRTLIEIEEPETRMEFAEALKKFERDFGVEPDTMVLPPASAKAVMAISGAHQMRELVGSQFMTVRLKLGPIFMVLCENRIEGGKKQ